MNAKLGLLTLCKREIIRYLVVFQQTLIPPLLTSLLFLFIFGVSVGENISLNHFQSSYLVFMIPGLLTMHLISSSFENTSSSLFIGRWHNHVQEMLLSPLSYIEMVLGFLAGGMSRGIITSIGVYMVSLFFDPTPISHPLLWIYFMVAITVIFSCIGLIAALWANNFGMLSLWGNYIITPAVFLGGVFNSISMLPEKLQWVAKINPMTYLVSGMRYSVIGFSDVSIQASLLVSFVLSAVFFCLTVYLFKIGYKLRA